MRRLQDVGSFLIIHLSRWSWTWKAPLAGSYVVNYAYRLPNQVSSTRWMLAAFHVDETDIIDCEKSPMTNGSKVQILSTQVET